MEQTDTPGADDAPSPPLYWICETYLDSWVVDPELKNVIGRHAFLWLQWYTARSARDEPWLELIRLWKRRRLPVPGARHFRAVNPRDRFVYDDEISSRASSPEAEPQIDEGTPFASLPHILGALNTPTGVLVQPSEADHLSEIRQMDDIFNRAADQILEAHHAALRLCYATLKQPYGVPRDWYTDARAVPASW